MRDPPVYMLTVALVFWTFEVLPPTPTMIDISSVNCIVVYCTSVGK